MFAGTVEEAEHLEEYDICSLPAKSGFCKALLRRYFFNADTKECETFNYGGCGGNENNFQTLEECISECARNDNL